MTEPYGIRGGESFLFKPNPSDEDNETFYANMKAADRHGRIFLVNTGYRCYLTERIYPYRYCMVFDDESGDRRCQHRKIRSEDNGVLYSYWMYINYSRSSRMCSSSLREIVTN